jgi:TolA-binding protein
LRKREVPARFSAGDNWAKLAPNQPTETCILPVSRSRVSVLLVLSFILQACAASPAVKPAAAAPDVTSATPGEAQAAAAPQLALTLPEQAQCDCPDATTEEYTVLEQGYQALLDGEYDEAMAHFERYQQLESSPRANLEAGIAIAYVRMLPRSSFYDPVQARNAFRVLREQNAKELGVHDYTRLMRQSLLNLLELQDKIDKLKANNAALKDDLEKREEALKRLRDLTLGQKAAEP